MNSFNHYSLGSVGEWMYSVVGGIRMLSAGYKTFAIHPVPGAGVSWAKTSFDSMYGRISGQWGEGRGEGGEKRFQMDVVVPANTTAYVYVPGSAGNIFVDGRMASLARDVHHERDEDGCAVFRVGSGKYRFERRV